MQRHATIPNSENNQDGVTTIRERRSTKRGQPSPAKPMSVATNQTHLQSRYSWERRQTQPETALARGIPPSSGHHHTITTTTTAHAHAVGSLLPKIMPRPAAILRPCHHLPCRHQLRRRCRWPVQLAQQLQETQGWHYRLGKFLSID